MKVLDIAEIEGVPFTGGTSYRPIVAKDGLGFSVCKTIVRKGGPYFWHYTQHLEACYCVAGMGILTNITTSEVYQVHPDIIYALDKHDEHTFEALTDVVLISIFNPPLNGAETHDENGTYKITSE